MIKYCNTAIYYFQKMLLGIIVSSLEEHSQLSTLVGYKRMSEGDDGSEHDLSMTEVLMNTLLNNLHEVMVININYNNGIMMSNTFIYI